MNKLKRKVAEQEASVQEQPLSVRAEETLEEFFIPSSPARYEATVPLVQLCPMMFAGRS